ncbi:hypothetical protein G7046_g6505 [Stylonectria norvegica]|nr:hypothetical protein G7046_g6505 [Stylonectria norvegica]
MKPISILALTLPLALGHAYPKPAPRALYFLDNNPSGSSVVALPIDLRTGDLGAPVRTSTGGKGLISNNAMGPVLRDSLNSQDSIIVHGSNIFTVNSGSNTLAHLHISPLDPLHPTLLGEPIPSGGDVPMSVAYSSKHSLVCVAHTGPRAGVDAPARHFPLQRPGIVGGAAEEEDLAARVGDNGAGEEVVDVGVLGEECFGGNRERFESRGNRIGRG